MYNPLLVLSPDILYTISFLCVPPVVRLGLTVKVTSPVSLVVSLSVLGSMTGTPVNLTPEKGFTGVKSGKGLRG